MECYYGGVMALVVTAWAEEITEMVRTLREKCCTGEFAKYFKYGKYTCLMAIHLHDAGWLINFHGE